MALKVAQFNSPLLDALAAKSLLKLANEAKEASDKGSTEASASAKDGRQQPSHLDLPSPARVAQVSE